MAGLLSLDGRQALLAQALGKAPIPAGFSLRLYGNDLSPDSQDTLARYQELPPVAGYAARSLSLASFTLSRLADQIVATAPTQQWVFSAGPALTIYGYYLVDAVGQRLIGAERFEWPLTVQTAGDQLTLSPQLLA